MRDIITQCQRHFGRVLRLGVGVLGLFTVGAALAQGFPSHSFTLISPYSAGGFADLLYRALGNDAAKTLGQSIVAENRPGASGKLGVLALLKAKGDPYTVVGLTNDMVSILPLFDADIRIEPGRDYTPVQISVQSLSILVAHPSMPFRDMKGFIAYVKANPHKVNMAITSLGGTAHIALSKLSQRTGIDVNIVPYKGEPDFIPALVAGEVQASMMSGNSIKPYVDSGKIVPLATTGLERWNRFPNVPTVQESGYPGWTSSFWIGLTSPADIPSDAAAKITSAFASALNVPETVKLYSDAGYLRVGATPQEMTQKIKADLAELGPIVAKIQSQIK